MQSLLAFAPIGLLIVSLLVKSMGATRVLNNGRPLAPATIAAIVSAALVVAAPLPLLGFTACAVAATAINLAFTAVLFADHVHLHFFRDVVSVAELGDAWQVGGVMSSVRAALKRSDLLLLVDVPVPCLALVVAAAGGGVPALDPSIRVGASGVLAVSGLACAIPLLRSVAGGVHRGPFESRALQRDLGSIIGIVYYHLADLISHALVRGRQRVISAAERESVRTFVATRRRSSPAHSLRGIAHGKNLLVLQAEALQSLVLDLEVNGQMVTPHLNAFARDSLCFPRCFEQTHGGSTSDATFIAMQSLYPLPVGAIATRYLGNRYFGLPAVLAQQGYRTLAAMGASGECWRMDSLFTRLGFQETRCLEPSSGGEWFGQGLADPDFVDQIVPTLVDGRRPFCALLVTVSAHHPYVLPEHHRRLNLGTLEGTLLGDYLHSIHFFDTAFGNLLDHLRHAGLLDETVVAVYGDHEAWLGDLPELAPLLGFDPDDAYAYWSVRKQVPLIIRLPNGQAARVSDRVAGQIDIAPTLLGLLGVDAAGTAMLGHDVLDENVSPVVLRDGSCTDGRWTSVAATSTRAAWTIANLAPARVRPAEARTRCFHFREEADCSQLASHKRAWVEDLRISDLIVQGDLVPMLTQQQTRARGRRQTVAATPHSDTPMIPDDLPLPPIQMLWIGGTLGPMEQCAVASFLAHGHPVHLYTYGTLVNVPAGTTLLDANEILPAHDLFTDDRGTYAGVSNVFRYTLMFERGGYWCDADVVCVRPFGFQQPFVFAHELEDDGTHGIGTCVMKCQPGSTLMAACLRACRSRGFSNVRWGEFGPLLFGRISRELGFMQHFLPPETFCPIPCWSWDLLLRDDEEAVAAVDRWITSATHAVHFWNEMWRLSGIDKSQPAAAGSFYEKVKRRYDTASAAAVRVPFGGEPTGAPQP